MFGCSFLTTVAYGQAGQTQIDSSRFNSLDLKVARPVYVGGKRRIDAIAKSSTCLALPTLPAAVARSPAANMTNATSPNFR